MGVLVSKRETVGGEEVTIRFEARRCIHTLHCGLGRLDVFVPTAKGEWIHPDRATPEEVATLAANRLSGANTFE
jgi:uncharacterized Fe-S cluster protein YjdI